MISEERLKEIATGPRNAFILKVEAEKLVFAYQQLVERNKQIMLLRDAILAVCCDPEGKVCIRGSDGDRAVLQEALDATENKQ